MNIIFMLQPEGCFYWQKADHLQEKVLNYFCLSNSVTYKDFSKDGRIIGENNRKGNLQNLPYKPYEDEMFKVYPWGLHIDFKNMYINWKKNGHQRMLAWPFNALYVHPGLYDETKIPRNMKLVHVLAEAKRNMTGSAALAGANKYIIGGP